MRVLLFGGTSEGRELALALAEGGVDVCVSVATAAGVGQMPSNLPHMTISCGAVEQEEKLRLFKEFDCVVDATHPFATSISEHVKQAAALTGTNLFRVVRPPSDTQGCLVAGSLEEALELIPAEGNVLATTGSKQIASYQTIQGFERRVYARVLDDEASITACREAGLSDDHILALRGPFSVEDNVAVIERFGIGALVTKDSGKAGGFPQKVQACRETGTACIVIARPAEKGMSVQEAFSAIMQIRSAS